MAKKKNKNVLGLCTATGGIGGATAGLIQGGSIGVAAFGGAVGLPLLGCSWFGWDNNRGCRSGGILWV